MIPLDLIAHAADLWDVSDGAITSHARGSSRLTEARQAVAFVLRQHDYTLMEIGAVLHRDHSTIIYSIKRAEQLADTKPIFAARLRALLAAADAPATAPPMAVRRITTITGPLRLALTFWGVAQPATA